MEAVSVVEFRDRSGMKRSETKRFSSKTGTEEGREFCCDWTAADGCFSGCCGGWLLFFCLADLEAGRGARNQKRGLPSISAVRPGRDLQRLRRLHGCGSAGALSGEAAAEDWRGGAALLGVLITVSASFSLLRVFNVVYCIVSWINTREMYSRGLWTNNVIELLFEREADKCFVASDGCVLMLDQTWASAVKGRSGSCRPFRIQARRRLEHVSELCYD